MEKLSGGENPTQLIAKLLEKLKPWEIENGKAEFTSHLYELYDREGADPPLGGTYTGLWEEFKRDAPLIYRAKFIEESVMKNRSNG